MPKKDKKLEIVSGDKLELNISLVYSHTSATKPRTQNNKPKNIIIPKETKKNPKKKKWLFYINIDKYAYNM